MDVRDWAQAGSDPPAPTPAHHPLAPRPCQRPPKVLNQSPGDQLATVDRVMAQDFAHHEEAEVHPQRDKHTFWMQICLPCLAGFCRHLHSRAPGMRYPPTWHSSQPCSWSGNSFHSRGSAAKGSCPWN